MTSGHSYVKGKVSEDTWLMKRCRGCMIALGAVLIHTISSLVHSLALF